MRGRFSYGDQTRMAPKNRFSDGAYPGGRKASGYGMDAIRPERVQRRWAGVPAGVKEPATTAPGQAGGRNHQTATETAGRNTRPPQRAR